MNRHIFTRILSAGLAALLTASVFSACSESAENADLPETADSQAADDAVPGEPVTDVPEEDAKILPDLPEITFDGADFRFYQWNIDGWRPWNDLYSEELTGEPINDNVFLRNSTIEEKYNVVITCRNDEYTTFESNVRIAVQAGEDDFDVIVSMGHDIPRMYTYNVFYNLHDVPYLDFEKPWWDKNCIESFTLLGYMPFTVSDMTILDKGVASATFFNKNMAADYGITGLYDCVYEGNWTIDKLIETGTVVETDTNGNGRRDDEDVYGLVCGDDPVYMLFHSAGGRYISQDENGMPAVSFQSENNFTAIQYYLEKLMYDENLTCNNSFKSGRMGENKLFAEDHGLYLMTNIKATNELREMESDFGILPIPKYQAEQDHYSSSVSVFGTNLISVPITTQHLEMTGVLLEALAAESRYTLIPAFYDTVIKDKSTRDRESADMLDIIFGNMVFDVGDFYSLADFPDYFLRITGSAAALGRDQRTSDIASFWAKKQKLMEVELKKLIKVIEQWNEMDRGG